MAEMQVNDASMSGIPSLIAAFGKLLGAVAAILLILSTAYDYSFLRSLGLTFEEIPSTLADHVRSAIVWVPGALLYLVPIVMYEIFMRRVEGGLSEEELIARSSSPRFMRAFRKGPKVLIAALLTISLALDFLLSASERALFVAAVFAWGSLAFWLIDHPRLGAGFTNTAGRLFVIVPVVVIWVASLGYARGDTMLRATVPTWKVELKGGSDTETRNLVGLRRFSGAAVLVEPERRVSVVPADAIVGAHALRSADADMPRICKWFAVRCEKTD